MITATVTDFRKNIKEYLDKVSKKTEALVINRGKDSGVVVLSLEEYNRLIQTQNTVQGSNLMDQAVENLISDKRFQRKLFEKGIEKLNSDTQSFEFLNEDTDWWDDLTEAQKRGIQRGLKDIEEGRVISHEEVEAKYGL